MLGGGYGDHITPTSRARLDSSDEKHKHVDKTWVKFIDMRKMRKGVLKFFVVLAGSLVGVIGFFSCLAFLVTDTCLDQGGLVGETHFVCIVQGGKELSWVVLLQPVVIVVTFGLIVLLAMLLVRYVLRWVDRLG